MLLFAVRVYQTFFSALMPSACKFYPTCSHYAAEAVRLYGARRGAWLALRRLLRCHPFRRGGVDLVPDPAQSPDEEAPAEGLRIDALTTTSGAKARLTMRTLLARLMVRLGSPQEPCPTKLVVPPRVLDPCPTRLVAPAQRLQPRPTAIVFSPQALKSPWDNLKMLVGRGFSHDIKPAISVSALAPEDLKRSYHTDSLRPRSTKLAAPAATQVPHWHEREGYL